MIRHGERTVLRPVAVALIAVAGCRSGGTQAPPSTAPVAIASHADAAAEVPDVPIAAPPTPEASPRPPLAQGVSLACAQVIDPAAYAAALGEQAPVTVRDVTSFAAAATASCSLRRGGRRLDAKAQAKLLKKTGRLGVLPGDEICTVTLDCWGVEDEASFRARCATSGAPDEDRTGGFACVALHAAGAFDVASYKFFDADTRCIIGVRGGPSVTDNDTIAACTRVARESIGPDHIKVDAAPRYAEPPPAP